MLDIMRIREADGVEGVHVTGPSAEKEAMGIAGATRRELDDRAALAETGKRLSLVLQPVRANSAFLTSLRAELVEGARHRRAERHASRRTALVAAATVGSLISVASVIGAAVYLARRRGHSQPLNA